MTRTPRATYLRAATVERGWADSSRNLQELIFGTVRRVLDESGLEFGDVDSVMLAAHDLVDGRSLSSMVSAPAAGAYLRDEARVGDDSAVALALASARVAAGLSRNCIVAAWGRASEGDQDRIANTLFDPFFGKPIGMTELAVSGMRASAALRKYPTYASHREAAARRRPRTAAADGRRTPSVAPLRQDELPIWSDLVCATVVTSDPTDLRIAGVGFGSEAYWPGDRDLLRMTALERAAKRAMSTIGGCVEDLAVLELDGLTLFDEALAAEAVGIAAAGEGMRTLASDERVNASGGYAAGYCAPAMGLVRTAAVVERLRAEPGSGRLGLATGSSTIAAQTQTAIAVAA